MDVRARLVPVSQVRLCPRQTVEGVSLRQCSVGCEARLGVVDR